ncbi:MAG: metallophosphoesterase [Planctomycetaceae bacterium]|nr:metallophosphoesterase [Planctomycetaceae bacterium]
MPIHIPTSTRREFLGTLGAGVVAFSVPGSSHATSNTQQIEQDVVCLLNDTHIGEKHPPTSARPKNLNQIVSQIIARKLKPAAVLINGDLASHDGQPGDYRHFAKLIKPLQTANINLHLTMGNHDNRETFYQVMQEQQLNESPVQSKHIAVVQTKHANFFLLDALIKTMVTQGEIGKEQLNWLADALDRMNDKPAIIMVHQNPRLGGDPLHFPGGLIDSQPLWEILEAHKHVKAYFHGHIHDRGFAKHKGIHIVNCLATSYVADKTKSTTGWTTAKLSTNGVLLTTNTTDPAHAWNNQTKELTWR